MVCESFTVDANLLWPEASWLARKVGVPMRLRRTIWLALPLLLTPVLALLVYRHFAWNQPSSPRTLEFPADRSFGMLYAGPAGLERIGEARGKVVVPPGKKFHLVIYDGAPRQVQPTIWTKVLRRFGMKIDTAASFDLSALRTFGRDDLHHLYIWETPLSTRELRHVERLRSLDVLSFQGSPISDAGGAPLRGPRSLRGLDLGSTGITDVVLAKFMGLTSLEGLELCVTKISDEGLRYLKGMSSLRSLGLNHTNVSDAGLANLTGMNRLQRLRLGNTKITNGGLAYIEGLTSLEYLSLDRCQISDAGLEHLREMTSLRSLTLDHTKITGTGLVHLKELKSLESLGLSGTLITDQTLVHLYDLTSLQSVGLNRVNVSDAAVAQLRKVLPNCTVEGLWMGSKHWPKPRR